LSCRGRRAANGRLRTATTVWVRDISFSFERLRPVAPRPLGREVRDMSTRRPIRRPEVLAVVGMLLCTACEATPGDTRGTRPPTISTADVHRFLVVAHGMAPTDSTCMALDGYLHDESAGLAAYRHKFDVGRPELCAAMHQNPERYARLALIAPSLDSAAVRIDEIFARARELVPGARAPDVYVVVGNGISGGNTTRGAAPMILIGAELLEDGHGVPATVAHELAHTLQRYPFRGVSSGPRFLQATVLHQSLVEGTADLMAELLTGKPKRNAYAEAHEAELWRDFQRDMHSRDHTAWLYNGRSQSDTSRPPDLGYWMGYRIAKAYYERSADKRAALHELLTTHDFDALVAASGYHGGR
jgi:Predicted Zn-dependent protease (DUF2268)